MIEDSRPTIIIRNNEGQLDKTAIFGFFTILAGIFVFYLGWDFRTDAMIFGIILIAGGIFQIINVFKAHDKTEVYDFAMKISADAIIISPVLNGETITKIPINAVDQVESYVSQGGTRSLDIKLKEGNELGKEYIHLDIANAKADWVQIKNCLNEIISSKECDRKTTIEKWKPEFIGIPEKKLI